MVSSFAIVILVLNNFSREDPILTATAQILAVHEIDLTTPEKLTECLLDVDVLPSWCIAGFEIHEYVNVASGPKVIAQH
jgi:hypothetical protein